ncbi:MAG: DUF1007 family protein [Ruegeria sp.]|uniref:DUF1007 family protein n=1 Tax=Ruegeria sp. TaxID=1879320 RepID=UPI00349E8CC3
MRILPILATCCLPLSAVAHPHVFIDTGFELIFDDEARLTHVRVTWAYDEFYSLLILEDMGLDQDGDGVLTGEEVKALAGFDAQWVEGYDGDLVVANEGLRVPLSGPQEPTATVEAGRIVTTHLREVTAEPVIASDLSVKAYDESYYTAYEVARPVVVSGPVSCALERIEPDIDARLAEMQAFLLTIDANADLEENDIPLIGVEFATEIRISCPGS